MIDETDNINRPRALNGIKADIERLSREMEAIKNQIVGLRKAQDILELQKDVK